jgi:hypothetical protein
MRCVTEKKESNLLDFEYFLSCLFLELLAKKQITVFVSQRFDKPRESSAVQHRMPKWRKQKILLTSKSNIHNVNILGKHWMMFLHAMRSPVWKILCKSFSALMFFAVEKTHQSPPNEQRDLPGGTHANLSFHKPILILFNLKKEKKK